MYIYCTTLFVRSKVPINLGSPECTDGPTPDVGMCSGGNVIVHNLTCIGSHGIAVGGIRHGDVKNVTFSNITATGVPFDTQGKYSPGGLRIKSYPNGTGKVHNILFESIEMRNVYMGIEVQSLYCPGGGCNPGMQGVQFANITFRNIHARTNSLAGKIKAEFLCSPFAHCVGILLDNVSLSTGGDQSEVACSNAEVEFLGASAPSQCTPAGKKKV